jgi:CDP-glycerol glycerophosphotransferase (TagB/SpsB family)
LIRVAQEPDGSACMVASDAMVSDHSSIAFEYTLLDRPLIIIDRPGLIERARINPQKVRQLRNAAWVAREPGAVVESVVRAIRHPRQLTTERSQIALELFHRPGTATDRALAHLYRVLELPLASTELTQSRASQAAVG